MNGRNVTFYYENRRLEGQAGEPIAKALFRAGIRTLSWSVKYKRPRSLHCARGRCVMCHMEVDGRPGVPTCVTPLEDGMRLRRENFRPFFAPLLVWSVRMISFPAGFYYRMFTRPAFVRKLFLGTLRKMAGVGRLESHRDGDQVPAKQPQRSMPVRRRHDIIVVGAGVSGMAAAVSAARNGADVLLVDEYAQPAGHSIGFQTDGELAALREQRIKEISSHDSITYLPNTTALAFYPPNRILLGPGPALGSKRQAMKTVKAATFIFATGGYDIVPVFDNNDVPGVFGARAMRLLLERDGIKAGKRAVVYGTGAALDELSDLLKNHDIDVVAVVDAGSTPVDAAGTAAPHRIEHARVVRADGRRWITAVTVRERDGGGKNTKLACDLLCTAFAGQGAYELPFQAGFRFVMSDDPIEDNRVMLPDEHARESADAACFAIGELAGQRHWREKAAAGEEVGARAAGTQQARQKR